MTTEKKHITQRSEWANTLDTTITWVLEHIRLRAQRRIAWLRHLWQEGDITGDGHNFHTEVDAFLENKDRPEAEYHWIQTEPKIEILNQSIADIETKLATQMQSRLSVLSAIFNLTKAESDLIQACLAIAIDPNFGKIYAYLQDNQARTYVTEELVARLFGHGYSLALRATSALKTWGLIQEKEMGKGEPVSLICDPYIRNWLLSVSDLDKSLVGKAYVQAPQNPLSNWKIEEAVDFFSNTLDAGVNLPVRFFITGAEGTGRTTLAAWIAKELGSTLLVIQSDWIAEQDWQQTFMRAQRQACLEGFALAWTGQGIINHTWKNTQPAPSLQFIIGDVDEFIQNTEGVLDYRLEMPPIPLDERVQIWQTFVPAAKTWAQEDLKALTQRHQATIGQIISVGEKRVSNIAEASEALKAAQRRRLGNLAQQLDCPFVWNDLIVPKWVIKNLEDFSFEATERVAMWEQPKAKRLFPQGKGLMALFTGPPGTGKTMAAQVIAAELKLDLYRIDLSSVVSKYVGETSKNIERILSRAQRMDAILLFDEADALFGKRTDIKDAHDRFANTDTNYLLQAIEQYPGIAILTSNKKANIDAGFTRRLRYVIEFSNPTVAERFILWQSIVGELAGTERLKVLTPDLLILAETLELTGAQIKLAILSGIFMARRNTQPLELPHLIAGIERELMKENRGVGRQLQELLLKKTTTT